MSRPQSGDIHGHSGGNETPAAAAADLAALPARRARFIRRPFVSRTFFVCGTAALTGDFALFVD